MMRTPFTAKIAAVVAAGTLVLAACGDDDDDSDAGADTTEATEATTEITSRATTEPSVAGTTSPPATTSAPGDVYASPDTTTAATDATDATTDTAASIVTTATSALGEILVGEDGFTVYGFTPDAGGTPTCVAGCASNWPPVLVDSAELPEGLDPAVFSVVEYPEGGFILRAGEWPLYYFAGDAAPGQTNGQGVSDVWFVVDPNGELIEG